MKQRIRAVLRRALGPGLRYFGVRFERLDEGLRSVGGSVNGVASEQSRLRELIEAYLSRHGSSETLIGRSLAAQQALLESMDVRQAALVERVDSLHDAMLLPILGDPDLEMGQLDRRGADYLNRATGWRGFASRAGVYINDPINYVYAPSSVQVLNINERIAELPFTFGEVAKVPPPARVLDIGSSESPVTLGLATLGYDVLAVDPRGYAFSHPNLSVAAVEAQELDDREPFDLVVMLSTIEHVGIGHYVEADDDVADLRVMERVAQLVRPGARLVLTTPFGVAAQDEVQRIYDPARLTKLLDGWDVEVVKILERVSDTQWDVVGDSIELPPGDVFRVAMVSAVLAG